MNATSCYWSCIDFYTLITYDYTLNCTYSSDTATGVVLKNFANFTGKHLCWSLFFTRLQAFRPAALLKRDSYTGVFLRNSEDHLFRKTSEQLLEMFHESVKKTVQLEFNVKIHCEIKVKLVFHEILWKKNSTVDHSLKSSKVRT